MKSALKLLEDAKRERSHMWELYHTWYNNPKDTTILRKHRRLQKTSKKDIKKAFYHEIRRKNAAMRMAELRIADQMRFNVLSNHFYQKTLVDFEFGRRIVVSYLR